MGKRERERGRMDILYCRQRITVECGCGVTYQVTQVTHQTDSAAVPGSNSTVAHSELWGGGSLCNSAKDKERDENLPTKAHKVIKKKMNTNKGCIWRDWGLQRYPGEAHRIKIHLEKYEKHIISYMKSKKKYK